MSQDLKAYDELLKSSSFSKLERLIDATIKIASSHITGRFQPERRYPAFFEVNSPGIMGMLNQALSEELEGSLFLYKNTGLTKPDFLPLDDISDDGLVERLRVTAEGSKEDLFKIPFYDGRNNDGQIYVVMINGRPYILNRKFISPSFDCVTCELLGGITVNDFYDFAINLNSLPTDFRDKFDPGGGTKNIFFESVIGAIFSQPGKYTISYRLCQSSWDSYPIGPLRIVKVTMKEKAHSDIFSEKSLEEVRNLGLLEAMVFMERKFREKYPGLFDPSNPTERRRLFDEIFDFSYIEIRYKLIDPSKPFQIDNLMIEATQYGPNISQPRPNYYAIPRLN